jgi:hypothetical protein
LQGLAGGVKDLFGWLSGVYLSLRSLFKRGERKVKGWRSGEVVCRLLAGESAKKIWDGWVAGCIFALPQKSQNSSSLHV